MNSYTYEKTYSYLYSKNKYIAIKKYLIAKDNDGQRYAIFQLVNNYRDVVQQIKIRVKQYDKDFKLINTNDIPYEGLSIRPHSRFVPFFKLAIDERTARITTSLVAAKFDSHVYKNGKLIRIKKEKTEEVKELKDRIDKNYNALKSKSPVKSFLVMSCIVLVLMALLIGVFSIANKKSIVDDFEYDRSSGLITNYYGSSKNVVIPKTIKKTDITGVDKLAFRNSDVQTVTFSSSDINIGNSAFMNCRSLTAVYANDIGDIGDSAFENCPLLKTIYANSVVSLGSKAFYNCASLEEFKFDSCTSVQINAFYYCTNLREVYIPNASVSIQLFIGNQQLNSFTFKDVFHDTYRLFTIFSNETDFKDLTVNTYIEKVDEYFLNGFSCGKINFLNPNVSMKNSLYNEWVNMATKSHNYTENSQYTKVYDVIVDFNASAVGTELNITDSTVKGIRASAMNKIASKLTSITMDNEVRFSSALLMNCTKLISINLGQNNAIEDGSIASMALQRLSIPVTGSRFNRLFIYRPNNAISLTLVGNKKIPSGYLSNTSMISELIVSNTIPEICEGAIESCTSLKSITIRNNNIYLAEKCIGVGCTSLTNVTIPFIGNSSTKSLKYKDLNDSYAYTVNLYVTYPSALTYAENCFDDCANLKYLSLKYGVTTISKSILGNLVMLEALALGADPGTSFVDVFGERCTVSNMKVSSISSFPTNYFSKAKIMNLFLGESAIFDKGLVPADSRITTIYISSLASTRNNAFDELNNATYLTNVYDAKSNDTAVSVARNYKYVPYYDVASKMNNTFK